MYRVARVDDRDNNPLSSPSNTSSRDMPQTVDLSRLDVSKEIAFRNQRCANRTARGTLLTDRASASERQQEGAQGSQQHVCASCIAHGAIGGRHCSPDGPWFCLGCWGELDGEALSSPAKRRWWDAPAHGAWLASVRPSLREQPIFAAGGEVHGEKFSVITDPANGYLPGVGADRCGLRRIGRKAWPT